MNHRLAIALVAGTLFTLPSHSVLAQVKTDSKLSNHLNQLSFTSQGPTFARAASPIQPAPMPMVDGYVVIDAIASGDAQTLLADLVAMGMKDAATFGNVVSGKMPVDQLQAMNSMTSLQFAGPAFNSVNVGLTTSQGDASQSSDIAKARFGLDGSGITIGTLSDSFDCSGAGGGAAADVANNDLPEGIDVLAEGGCSDEGRAMMQLMHDVAPGSNQAFHTAFGGTADFAQGIIELQQAGSDIIVDDVIYFAEPMFQDGIIAQAAQAVADNGSAYFSSAGNNGRNSYEAAYEPSGFGGVFGGNLHDWDPGPGIDFFQDFLLEPGTTFIVLNWADTAASSGGPGSSSDLDFFLWFQGNPIFQVSSFSINIGGDPVEIIGVSVSSPLTVQLSVELFEGPAPALLKYVTFGSDERRGFGAQEYATSSASSYGHSNAANIAGVGAAAYFNTAAFNEFCQPACLNGFSSAGGTPILFEADGTPTFELRGRPNFVGPDGANTTFFGFDFEGDGFPNFFGTSASAPHAAAGAALLLQANPSLTPAGIYQALADTAIDMNEPGFDDDTGAGFINIEAAVDLVATDPDNAKKRLVCHNSNVGQRTISVSTNAVQAHVKNGDRIGPCE